MFLSRETQIILLAILAVIYGLSLASRRYPDVAWLCPFHLPQLTPQQQPKQRRRANIHVGFEMILIGVVIPIGYAALTVMMFNDFDPLITALVIGGSLLCIALGVTAIVRSRRE